MDAVKTTLITHVEWGKMEVTIDGQPHEFKDCKVWTGGAKEWDWGEAGTHHHPGIQAADIEEIVAQDVEVMVLSRGMELKLHTTPEAEALLKSKGIAYHILETNEAVAMFNKFSGEGKRVGGIFHSTC